jgi:hypothetical protein
MSYKIILSQIFEIEKKILLSNDDSFGIQRHIDRMKSSIEEEGYIYHSPINERYTEMRIDCEASIVGDTNDRMIIQDVIKPIIYKIENGERSIVQKGIVIVEKQK